MYLSYIDSIRAFAVLSVMIYHLNSKWLPGGFSGLRSINRFPLS
jgi:peptidoglycan/LPS O-acetylase OafA/YrhL